MQFIVFFVILTCWCLFTWITIFLCSTVNIYYSDIWVLSTHGNYIPLFGWATYYQLAIHISISYSVTKCVLAMFYVMLKFVKITLFFKYCMRNKNFWTLRTFKMINYIVIGKITSMASTKKIVTPNKFVTWLWYNFQPNW